MRAAVIKELGQAPVLVDRNPPQVGDGRALLEMEAVALNPVDIAIAAGSFYAGHPELPFVPCIEGVGRRDGRLVYVQGAGLGISSDGVASALVAAPPAALIDLPDGADPATAAALGTAGLAGWMAVHEAEIQPDDVVVVLGATGAAGRIAVQAARLAGAARIVAVGRSEPKLAAISGLCDVTVALGGGDLAERVLAAARRAPSVVIDLLWGEPLMAILGVLAPRARVVHLGASAGPTATVPSAPMRGKQLRMIGYSNFGLSRESFTAQYLHLVGLAATGQMEVDLQRFTLDEVALAWTATSRSETKAVVTFAEGDR